MGQGMTKTFPRLVVLLVGLGSGFFILFNSSAWAKPFYKGAEICQECHEAEYKIWEETQHFKAFRTAHREPKEEGKPSPRKIVTAVGGEKRMKKNETCTLCHYTMQQEDEGGSIDYKSGPSCESCHGPSSDYLKLHDDYGGKDVRRDAESPEHKAKRIADSAAVGFIWPTMKYEIAENCMTCHGLAHEKLTGDALAKMLGAGHPINPDFELIKYSQGSVRHRYYWPDLKVNKEMTPQELAELFVIGQAAKLVSAAGAMSKSNEPKYKAAQEKRASDAKSVLSGLTGIPEAAALISAPTRENAKKFTDAIAGKDLTAQVGGKLPAKSDYK